MVVMEQPLDKEYSLTFNLPRLMTQTRNLPIQDQPSPIHTPYYCNLNQSKPEMQKLSPRIAEERQGERERNKNATFCWAYGIVYNISRVWGTYT